MKKFGNPLLSLAAPFLIIVASIGFIHRQGTDRSQPLPALAVGVGLIISGAIGRRNRRKNLLLALNRKKNDQASH